MVDEPKKECRICRKPLVERDMGERNDFKLVACVACGSVWAEPWPTVQSLEQFFAEIEPQAVHRPSPAGEIARAKQNLLQLKGLSGPSLWDYLKDLIQRKLLKKPLPKKSAPSPFTSLRFLDAGSRQGYATVGAKELGFADAHGIDSHEFFVTFAKSRYDSALFEQATLQEYAARGREADIVYSVENISEQVDPDAWAAALKRVLAAGGKAYLQEPDGNHWRLPPHFPAWNFIDPPFNFLYISAEGLKALLARHGLRIEKRFSSWTPVQRVIVGHKK